MVWAPQLHCRGHGFNPWSGNLRAHKLHGKGAPPKKTKQNTVNVSISLRMEPKRKRVEGTDSKTNSILGFKSQGCHSLPMQPEANDFNSECLTEKLG